MKELMIGNAAVARGLYEAGCRYVSSYPGTPSTEITEFAAGYDEVYAEWASNEKVALESAVGASLAGARSFTAIAVVGSSAQAWPCGICRQVLNEFSDNMRVICGQYGQDFDVVPLAELLPHSFGPEHLGVQEGGDGK